MKVRAVRIGFYGKKRRRPGEEFTLTDPAHFSDAHVPHGAAKLLGWMEKVEEEERPQPTKKPAK